MKVKKLATHLGGYLAGVSTACVVVWLMGVEKDDPKYVSWEDHVKNTQVEGNGGGATNGEKSAVAMSRLQTALIKIDGVEQMTSKEEPADFVVVPSSMLEELSSKLRSVELKEDLFTADSSVDSILKITDQEKAQLQRSWRGMQRELKAMELKLVEVDELEDGSVRIQLPDMSEKVKGMGENYMAGVTSVLGENRGRAFSAIKQLDSAFSMAEGETTYEIKMESTGDGFWRYHLKQNGASGSRAWVGQKIPNQLRHLTEVANIVSELESPTEDED